MEKSFNSYIEESIRKNWDLPALSDYHGATYCYKDIARRIEKMHIIFEKCGLKRGDKISIAGRNSANWGIVFLSTLTYGAVAVPILHEFKPDNIHHVINHSESRILFVGSVVWEGLNEQLMPNIEAIISIDDLSLLYAKKKEIYRVRETLNELFGKKFPFHFHSENFKYYEDKPEELAIINYTSGTTGFSKGVMIPYRALASNIEFAQKVLPDLKSSDNVVSMLPMAHMYGLMFEFIYEMSVGCHVHYLTRMPTPKIITEAFSNIHPRIVIAVPLIVEKIYKNKIRPIVDKPMVRMLLKMPIIDAKIRDKIKTNLIEAFGGKVIEVVVGGASFNREAEEFFKKIGFPYTTGYGMTECAPIIAYADWRETRLYSCGKCVMNMEMKIDSPDPQNIVGEILVRGKNVFLGYYKNKEATKAALDSDGWMHTGDLGVIDKDGYLYIKGRSKNMILGPSGQNIYPEEIEDRINNMDYVNESLVVEDEGKLVALVYPDYDQADRENITHEEVERRIDASRVELNKELPNFSQISRIKIYPEEFEKTPKRSIKRFLYQK